MPARRSQTLEQLEGQDWGEPGAAASGMIAACYRLRRVPVDTLSVEDLRLLIGQGIGLVHLMPRALDLLERDPWVGGDHYEGDLLHNVLRVGREYWSEHADQLSRLTNVIDEVGARSRFFEQELYPAWLKIFADE